MNLIEKADQLSKKIFNVKPDQALECERCGSYYDLTQLDNNKDLQLKVKHVGLVKLCPCCQRKLEWWFNFLRRGEEDLQHE